MLSKGSLATSNGKELAEVTYVSVKDDYVELRYSDGFSFRARLSEYRDARFWDADAITGTYA
jgi:hypothetical protein